MNNVHNPKNRTFTGAALIGGGLLLLAYKMGAPIPGWIFSWPSIMIAISLFVGIRQGFRNIGWLILLVIGAVGLANQFFPDLDFDNYMGPIIIIGIGAWFILRPKSNFDHKRGFVKEWNNDTWQQASTDQTQTQVNDSEFLRINSVFSGFKRTVISKNFQGGNISCVFGGAEVDLTQADFNGVIMIKIEQVFGGTKLIIPPHWKLVNEVEGVFHGVDDKRNNTAVVDPNKTLVIKGSVVFGGVDIRSY